MARAAIRVDQQTGYVLHSYPYKESSLLVEVLTPEHGRVAMVARGAKRPRSELRGLLQAFTPLVFGWTGRGEVKSLVRADWRGGVAPPAGEALLCGFYLNELLLRMLPREDPHPRLFAEYELALAGLSDEQARPAVLRRFELHLLAELGYGLELAREADSGRPIAAEARYYYVFERGPVRDYHGSDEATVPQVRGATLQALAADDYADPGVAAEAKALMREVLNHHLEHRALFSRRLIQDLQALELPPTREK